MLFFQNCQEPFSVNSNSSRLSQSEPPPPFTEITAPEPDPRPLINEDSNHPTTETPKQDNETKIPPTETPPNPGETPLNAEDVPPAANFSLRAKPDANGKPILIFKFDDFDNYFNSNQNSKARWERVLNYLQQKGHRANIGIIGSHFAKNTPDDQNFYEDVKANRFFQSSLVEFWNHGYCFCLKEEDFTNQKSADLGEPGITRVTKENHVKVTQDLVKIRLGLDMIGYGAPGNVVTHWDQEQVLNNIPQMRLWLWGNKNPILTPFMNTNPNYSGKVLWLGIRTGTLASLDGKNSTDLIKTPTEYAEKFKELLASPSRPPYMVLQAHPGKWSDSQFNNFKRAFDKIFTEEPDLKSMTLREYYQHLLNQPGSLN